MTIAKNARRDFNSGAVIFTDSSEAAKARIRRKNALSLKKREAEIASLKNEVSELKDIVRQLLQNLRS